MDILKEIYYDPKTGFNSATDLYEKAIKKDVRISMNDVKRFLKQQKNYQITSKQRNQPYHKIVCNDDTYFIDITFFQNPKANSGFIGLFTIIECTSRYAYAYGIKTKTTKEYISIFEHFLKKINGKINIVISDNEFFNNNAFKKLLEERGIIHIVEDPYKHSKLNLLNRFHLTLKNKLEKYFIANDTDRWIDVIDDIIYNYNNTKHSTLGTTPAIVNSNNELKEAIRNKLRAQGMEANELKNQYEVGDRVRHKLTKNMFEKNYSKYSESVYVIDKIEGNSFTLRNPENDYILKNKYQYHELKKVDNVQTIDKVEEKPKRQTRGEKQTERRQKNLTKELGNEESGKIQEKGYKWNREFMANVDLDAPRQTRRQKQQQGAGVADEIGPIYWKLIHMTAKYKPTNLVKLMKHVEKTFPCSTCREHIGAYLKENPITEDTFKWSVQFHNNVNKRLGKPIISLSRAEKIHTLPKT